MLYTCYRATNFAFVCVCVEREEKALPRKGVPQGMPRKGVQKRCALSCAKGVKKMTLRCRPKQRTFGRRVMRFACNAPQKSPVVFLKRALFAAQKSPVWGLKLLVYESWSYQCSNDPGLFCATHSALMLSWAHWNTQDSLAPDSSQAPVVPKQAMRNTPMTSQSNTRTQQHTRSDKKKKRAQRKGRYCLASSASMARNRCQAIGVPV